MSKLKILALSAALALAGAAVALPGNAWAQAVNVFDFSCKSPFSVSADVMGLGRTNLCVTGSATVDLSCACVGGGWQLSH